MHVDVHGECVYIIVGRCNVVTIAMIQVENPYPVVGLASASFHNAPATTPMHPKTHNIVGCRGHSGLLKHKLLVNYFRMHSFCSFYK